MPLSSIFQRSRALCGFEQLHQPWRAYIESMASMTLEQFIGVNRDELISRCRTKVSKRSPPGAVTEHARDQPGPRDGGSLELRNLANTALVAFEALQSGNIGVGGSTGGVLQRSLMATRALADHPPAEIAPLKSQ